MSMTNCINCGASKEVTASICPFCGTSYFDLTDIDLSNNRKPCVVRFKYNENIFQMKAFLHMASFEFRPQILDVSSLDGTKKSFKTGNDISANIEFICCD